MQACAGGGGPVSRPRYRGPGTNTGKHDHARASAQHVGGSLHDPRQRPLGTVWGTHTPRHIACVRQARELTHDITPTHHGLERERNASAVRHERPARPPHAPCARPPSCPTRCRPCQPPTLLLRSGPPCEPLYLGARGGQRASVEGRISGSGASSRGQGDPCTFRAAPRTAVDPP